MRGAGAERVTTALLELPRMRTKVLISALPVKILAQSRDEAYRLYVTDALNVIAFNTANAYGGKTMSKRYADIIDPKPEDNRTAEQIIDSVVKNAGLKIGGDGK